jgi:hypothetical protein
MPGTSCADFTIETFPSAEALPSDALALLDGAAGFFATRAWWRTVVAHAMPPDAEPFFLAIRSHGRLVAVIPMLRSGGTFGSLTTPYTCAFIPLLVPGLDRACQIGAMAAFARLGRAAGIVRLDALPAEWDDLVVLEAGARQAGMVPLRFDHFGNWQETVRGLDWSAYLLGRTGALRETIRRRLRQAEKRSNARFDLFTRPDEMDQATEAFESVYRRSWKEPEPYPEFNVALIRESAELGVLRLGVWSVGAEPVAVQLWIALAGHATVLKLAHDEAFKVHSPGTVLTALMLKHLLNVDHVTRIDFGRGDDAYKQGWAAERRQRIGILLVNPWCIAGMIALLRHSLSRIRRAYRRSLNASHGHNHPDPPTPNWRAIPSGSPKHIDGKRQDYPDRDGYQNSDNNPSGSGHWPFGNLGPSGCHGRIRRRVTAVDRASDKQFNLGRVCKHHFCSQAERRRPSDLVTFTILQRICKQLVERSPPEDLEC